MPRTYIFQKITRLCLWNVSQHFGFPTTSIVARFQQKKTVMENDALTLLNHFAANNDMFNEWKYWVYLAFLKYGSTKLPSIQYG